MEVLEGFTAVVPGPWVPGSWSSGTGSSALPEDDVAGDDVIFFGHDAGAAKHRPVPFCGSVGAKYASAHLVRSKLLKFRLTVQILI